VVGGVTAVRMVEGAVDELVDLIPMRHRFMAAPRSVNVRRLARAQKTSQHCDWNTCVVHGSSLLSIGKRPGVCQPWPQ
jgi:hypothetical protein